MKAGGKVTVSARSEDMTLVPPVCRIHSDAGSILVLMVIMMIAIVAVATVTFFTIKKHIATRTLK
jgi:phosphotransferase system  glucose/maltose/N-acetylglucosamine-specific IIC component